MIETAPASYGADITRLSPVGRTRKERDHLAQIESLSDYLASRSREATTSTAYRDRLRAEVAALRWALARIADAERMERDA